MIQSNKSSFLSKQDQRASSANPLAIVQNRESQKARVVKSAINSIKEVAMQTQKKANPRLGDVRVLVEWVDAAKWERMARTAGWKPDTPESLYDYVEADDARKWMEFKTIAAAKAWAEQNYGLDEWKSPFVMMQVYKDDGYGAPYSWEIEIREIWDDGEWSGA